MTSVEHLDNWAQENGFVVSDVYSGPGVNLYLEVSNAYDLVTPITLAIEAEGPVLELCCGAGRVGVPLLLAGVDYHGVDNAPDMLREFRKAALDHEITLDERLTCSGVDAYQPGPQVGDFALVLMPAFSIVLLEEKERSVLLKKVNSLVAPGGYVAFEVYRREYYDKRYKESGRMCDWTALAGGESLVTLSEFFEGKEVVRFIKQSPLTPPIILATSKFAVSSDQLQQELLAAGFSGPRRMLSSVAQAEWLVVRK